MRRKIANLILIIMTWAPLVILLLILLGVVSWPVITMINIFGWKAIQIILSIIIMVLVTILANKNGNYI